MLKVRLKLAIDAGRDSGEVPQLLEVAASVRIHVVVTKRQTPTPVQLVQLAVLKLLDQFGECQTLSVRYFRGAV